MNYICDICGKEVNSSQGLAGHKRFKHGDRPNPGGSVAWAGDRVDKRVDEKLTEVVDERLDELVDKKLDELLDGRVEELLGGMSEEGKSRLFVDVAKLLPATSPATSAEHETVDETEENKETSESSVGTLLLLGLVGLVLFNRWRAGQAGGENLGVM